jgi:prefoldin subunit 5
MRFVHNVHLPVPFVQINLGAIPIDQLNGLKQQLEEEVQQLSRNYASLREAQVRFQESNSSLRSLTPDSAGKSPTRVLARLSTY